MSTTNTASRPHRLPTAEAPWKDLFQSHLGSMGSSPEFNLATVTAAGLPRSRTCIHRGFFASPLPHNPHNKHPSNPHLYDSDCPIFTTDARMSKVYDIFATGKGKGTLEFSRLGTGGGGYVEVCYWAKEKATQWRIGGRCWILASDDVEDSGSGDEPDGQNSGVVIAKAEIGRYLRPSTSAAPSSSSSDPNSWTWRREVEMHFANLSPVMRGSFKNPPPGEPQSVSDSGQDEGLSLGQRAGDLEEEPVARKNFRVAVIAPETVEMVDLNDPEKSFRRRWTLSKGPSEGGDTDEWIESKLWP